MTVSNKQLANAIRFLSIDAVNAANSGHPGMPMGMADMAVSLWKDHLSHNPNNPKWINRDRFVLSNGHGSMLLYSLLHLTGYNLPLSELKNFRQLHSKTPGHPEYGITAGVETTTGPLGQGLSNAVGMALAERLSAREFNQTDLEIINHYAYVFLGDGCLMEGISHEACSLAGTLKLNKLIALYDDNGISIDGQVAPWFSDNTAQRFLSYGWNVIENINGHDSVAVSQAIAIAKQSTEKPTLIICKTNIGEGSPTLAGSDKVHGAPLGSAEREVVAQHLGWENAPFEIPQEIRQEWLTVKDKGQEQENNWNNIWHEYQAKYPKQASELLRRYNQELPQNWLQHVENGLTKTLENPQTIATRKASQNAITHFAEVLPEFLGGSADLTSSNLTNWKSCVPVRSNSGGNHINYGVREFGMSGIMNGLSLYGTHLPFGATFLTFSDYSRNALRMAALMNIRSIFVFTHDSIGLGEDGPTHQPVEHIASLRLIPNLQVWRPCDEFEMMVAWQQAIENIKTPTVLIGSRQNLKPMTQKLEAQTQLQKTGAQLITAPSLSNRERRALTIIATGSEVELAISAFETLKEKGIAVQVVSMPCPTLFTKLSTQEQEAIVGNENQALICVEAGIMDGWYRIANGRKVQMIGMNSFGDSAPAKDLYKHFGITVEAIVNAGCDLMN